jgi:flavin reductase (DIM6/NTAB) family NADH-FMN oxidoreductase RutF
MSAQDTDCPKAKRAGKRSTALVPEEKSFRFLAGHWATGVAIVTTAADDGRKYGLTMSAVTTLSLEPMQFLICVDNRSSALAAILQAQKFGINYLGLGQQELAHRFSRAIPNKFAGVAHRCTASGVPVLKGVIGFVECRLSVAVPGGDHRIIIGDVQEMIVPGGEPLVHFRGQYRKLL